MLNKVRSLFSSVKLSFSTVLAVLCLAIMAVPCFATDPPPIDYATDIAAAQTSVLTAVGTSFGPLLIVCAVMLAVRFAWKKFRQAAKSA